MHSNGIFMKFLLAAFLALFVAACSTPPPPEVTPTPVVEPTPTPELPPGPAAGSYEELMEVVGDRVFFAYDSADLSTTARSQLGQQAQWLNTYSNVSVTIEGHADSRGTREYNLALGERRASAVKNYLVALGVSAGRINTISYGKERPMPNALCQAESCWTLNRRGVMVVN